MTSPLVTNGGYNGNAMNGNVNGNPGFPSQMSNGVINCNGNGNFHGGMVESQALVSIPTLPIPLTPVEKEVKELREMLLKFMNKDGINLQALNF